MNLRRLNLNFKIVQILKEMRNSVKKPLYGFVVLRTQKTC